ncbi:MAG: hypothetical protein CVV27_10835 [Candidatus Melainabacteria bacterium HGW-Melainabacteria-1]|nr:MAG: hypothetical protein CVV27_10835 [Candidatus Melainabacteria bacterium HGW-Melainabacteria-1]
MLGTATLPVVRRFLNEVRITAQLEHPAIVPIYQLQLGPGSEPGLPELAYSMKLIQGETLKQRIQRIHSQLNQAQPLGENDQLRALLEVFIKVCDAMAYAHSRQVIHRDLKPANIMIGPYGDVYVLDWGIARRFKDKDPQLFETSECHASDQPVNSFAFNELSDLTQIDQTQAGQILGTPRYMSPQQAAGRNAELDGRSDLFSLGLILYELLTLKPAFKASSAIELLKKVLKVELEPMLPPNAKWPIPAPLKAIVARATGRKPDDRYPDVESMAQDIRRYLNGEKVQAYAEPWIWRGLRLLRRHGRVTLLASLGICLSSLLIIGGSLWWSLRSSDLARTQEAELSRFLSAAAAHTQLVDQHMLAHLGRLESLAATARQALKQGQGVPVGQIDQTLLLPPPDLADAPTYGQRLSLEWPSLSFDQGVNPSDLIPEISRLMLLRRLFKDLFIQASDTQNPQAFAHKLRQQGISLVWAYVSLTKGVQIKYPGSAVKTGDPQQGLYQAQFQQAIKHQQPFWGMPYPDVSGKELQLPALAPLRDASGKLLGVAGIEIALRRWADERLRMPELPQVQVIELLNPQGQVLLQLENRPGGAVKVFEPSKTHPLLSEKVRQQAEGVMPLPAGGQLAWFRIASLGWSLVLSAPKSQTP